MRHTSTSRIHHDGGSFNSFVNVTLRKDEDGGGGGSDIYSWLSLVADIQWGKSDAQKPICNDGTIQVCIWKEGGVVDGAGYVGVGEIR